MQDTQWYRSRGWRAVSSFCRTRSIGGLDLDCLSLYGHICAQDVVVSWNMVLC